MKGFENFIVDFVLDLLSNFPLVRDVVFSSSETNLKFQKRPALLSFYLSLTQCYFFLSAHPFILLLYATNNKLDKEDEEILYSRSLN